MSVALHCKKQRAFSPIVKPLLHWLHREVPLIPAALRQAEPGDDPCVTIVIPSGVVLENCVDSIREANDERRICTQIANAAASAPVGG
jgi:hypothetical protein